MEHRRARGVDRKVDQKKEALAAVVDLLGGRDRMTDKLYNRIIDRRTFTTEDLREIQRLFRRSIDEELNRRGGLSDGIRFVRRMDGDFAREA